MRTWMKRLSIALLLPLGLAACASDVPIPETTPRDPLRVDAGSEPRSLYLAKVSSRIEPGHHYGLHRGGALCAANRQLKWKSSTLSDQLKSRAKTTFAEESKLLGYQVINQESDVFKEAVEVDADLKVVALLSNMVLNSCSKQGGESYMKIAWQVYDGSTNTILHETTSEGSFSLGPTDGQDWDRLFLGAFRRTAQQLMADPAYRDLAQGTPNS